MLAAAVARPYLTYPTTRRQKYRIRTRVWPPVAVAAAGRVMRSLLTDVRAADVAEEGAPCTVAADAAPVKMLS